MLPRWSMIPSFTVCTAFKYLEVELASVSILLRNDFNSLIMFTVSLFITVTFLLLIHGTVLSTNCNHSLELTVKTINPNCSTILQYLLRSCLYVRSALVRLFLTEYRFQKHFHRKVFRKKVVKKPFWWITDPSIHFLSSQTTLPILLNLRRRFYLALIQPCSFAHNTLAKQAETESEREYRLPSPPRHRLPLSIHRTTRFNLERTTARTREKVA